MFVIWIYELENCFLDVWFCFDYFLICFSLFCRFCLFFFRRRRHNKVIKKFENSKKTLKKSNFFKKQILQTFMFFFIDWNFHDFFFVETIKKSYVTIFIEKSSAFMKITLLFYYFLMILLRRCGRKKTLKKHSKSINNIKWTIQNVP